MASVLKQFEAVLFIQLGVLDLNGCIALSDLLADQLPRLLFPRACDAVRRTLHLGRPPNECNSCGRSAQCSRKLDERL